MHIKFIASALIAALLMTGTATSVSPASGQGAQLTQTPVAETATLTEAEATAIALEHAKLNETDVTQLRVRLDRDDRRSHWEVHWRSGDWEYSYDIDLTTGAILEWDRDHEPLRKAATPTESRPTEPKATEPKPTEPTKSEKTYISADEAKAIALKHAGLTADQVTGLRAKFDFDDRTAVYEVEFRAGRYEYDYDIHAESGRVLDSDKDRDD